MSLGSKGGHEPVSLGNAVTSQTCPAPGGFCPSTGETMSSV
eukprot:CAMPEP_0197513452 /NCGR_PEP_ID=MMETSP1312-20131121/80752_1 /TAXON_ID=464262 /ORGANISM="Genus nov. species nov., Strain RCC2335" /LENGTH=40 /DNA_ID= /DNA_START= /DNA_END= /DNA_ORIENTATION=